MSTATRARTAARGPKHILATDLEHRDSPISAYVKVRLTYLILGFIAILVGGCGFSGSSTNEPGWSVTAIPSSIRLDPTTNEIIEDRFDAVEKDRRSGGNILERNWIYDGDRVSLHAARGEYISFQLIITNNTDSTLRDISVDISPFQSSEDRFQIDPELFLAWSVEVKTPSTGYSNTTLGEGWYPDALIPFDHIQDDTSKVESRWLYPLWLPDFNNRVEEQRSHIVWVDQYVPLEYGEAKPGRYTTDIAVTIGDEVKRIPIDLNVWDFAIPNENELKASLQHEGFVSGKDEEAELEIYHVLRRNRISLMDPTYEPELRAFRDGEIEIGWEDFDDRLEKYFSGEAFTDQYGYEYGPGYGEPIETFVLPFDVYRTQTGRGGWPDIGSPEVEREPENRAIYVNTIREVRDHLQPMIDPSKTDIFAFLNGLDESYFPEAWERMVYYGELFQEYYPEARHRVDGGYSEEAMEVISSAIDDWAAHTINYNIDTVRTYQDMGIKDWLYGPMLYESRVNSWVGSSTFIDLPLVNDRAISWSTWKYDAHSWISWGVGAGWRSAWYDPETWKSGRDSTSSYREQKLNGNGQLIYSPGIVPNVPVACPSIRLKALRNGVQEYEYMRLLSEIDGHSDRVNEVVNDIIGRPFGDSAIGNIDVWSFDAEEWDIARVKLGELIHEARQQANGE